jgi:hypothetical protein
MGGGGTSDEDWDTFEIMTAHDGDVILTCPECRQQINLGSGFQLILDLRNAAMDHNEEVHGY